MNQLTKRTGSAELAANGFEQTDSGLMPRMGAWYVAMYRHYINSEYAGEGSLVPTRGLNRCYHGPCSLVAVQHLVCTVS